MSECSYQMQSLNRGKIKVGDSIFCRSACHVFGKYEVVSISSTDDGGVQYPVLKSDKEHFYVAALGKMDYLKEPR